MKKCDMGSTQQTSNLFSIFCRSEKKCIFVHLMCFDVYFGVLRVNMGGFESFSSIWGMFKVTKTSVPGVVILDIEHLRSLWFWSIWKCSFRCQIQNILIIWVVIKSMYENQKILKFKIENQKSIWSTHVFWCVIQFCQTDVENVTHWMTSSIKCLCYFAPKGDQIFHTCNIFPTLVWHFGSRNSYS